jgi:hypothetical protein
LVVAITVLDDHDRLSARIGSPPHGGISSPTYISTSVVSTIVVVVSAILSTFLDPVRHIPTIYIALVSTIVQPTVIPVLAPTTILIVHTPRVHSVGTRFPLLPAIYPGRSVRGRTLIVACTSAISARMKGAVPGRPLTRNVRPRAHTTASASPLRPCVPCQ